MIEKLQFTLDEKGFIDEFMLPGGAAMLPKGQLLDLPKDFNVEDFQQNFQAYCLRDNKLERDEDRLKVLKKEQNDDLLRWRRQRECFQVINRSALWHETLNENQKKELKDWYHKWLDVTDTNEIPKNPEWLK